MVTFINKAETVSLSELKIKVSCLRLLIQFEKDRVIILVCKYFFVILGQQSRTHLCKSRLSIFHSANVKFNSKCFNCFVFAIYVATGASYWRLDTIDVINDGVGRLFMNRKAKVNRYMCVEPAVVCGKRLVATAEVCMHVTFAQRNVRIPTANCANKLVLVKILTKFVRFKKKTKK